MGWDTAGGKGQEQSNLSGIHILHEQWNIFGLVGTREMDMLPKDLQGLCSFENPETEERTEVSLLLPELILNIHDTECLIGWMQLPL